MRFVFARERLPARPAQLGIKFKMQGLCGRDAEDDATVWKGGRASMRSPLVCLSRALCVCACCAEPLASSLAAPDAHLPSSHTCFFSLSLPPFSSQAILRTKLFYAMYACVSMDSDVRLQDAELAAAGVGMDSGAPTA
jgi:hypothetical protein